MKKTVMLMSFLFAFFGACVEERVNGPELHQTIGIHNISLPQDVLEWIDPMSVYPFTGSECIECQWYFCPPLDSVWQKQICVDYCADPPLLMHEGECAQYLECDPNQYLIEEVQCITIDGFPGLQSKVCNKGQIQYTDCVTDCQEETCNYEDDDCDDYIDEGQLNECNTCGIVPPETCNGIDDDCNGFTDESLIQMCGTVCGSGFEICEKGNWISCTAPTPGEEICDGFDNNCDGQIDEGLECVCSIQDVGVLFPCQESPLKCGLGYKTCECIDETCKTFTMTDCLAMCFWVPPDPPEICDPHVGIELSEEDCNNFDDNCNGEIDEDLYSACYTGPEGTLNIGICEPGIMTCDSGIWGNYNQDGTFVDYYCEGEVVPDEEICNGIDDDCDGVIDWGGELKDTDILFIVDWSGSMVDEINAVMIALNQFAQKFSEEEAIKWSFVRGPVGTPPYYFEELILQQNLTGFSDYLAALSAMGLNVSGMSTSFEMILDAIYLSVHNITTVLPYPISSLNWTGAVNVFPLKVKESTPPIKDFKINWRTDADKIIIVFSDEYPQSYMIPTITTEIIQDTVAGVPQLKLYTFSRFSHKAGWEKMALAGNGEWYNLTSNPTEMYANLISILNDMCTGAKDE